MVHGWYIHYCTKTLRTVIRHSLLRQANPRPYVNIKGCLYYLTQSTWWKVQQLGLTADYKGDKKVWHFCGMTDGLAFLPVDDVEDSMAYLKTQVVGLPSLLSLLTLTVLMYRGPAVRFKTPMQIGQPHAGFLAFAWDVNLPYFNQKHEMSRKQSWIHKRAPTTSVKRGIMATAAL